MKRNSIMLKVRIDASQDVRALDRQYLSTLVRNLTLDINGSVNQNLGIENTNGTKTWCKKCQSVTECRVSEYENDSKGIFTDSTYPDLNYRIRPRECLDCGDQFRTYEIDDSYIDELVELRKLITSINSQVLEQIKSPTSIEKLLNSFKNE